MSDVHLYCPGCKRWVATVDDDGGFECTSCRKTILCDDCGLPFAFDHAAESGHA